LSVVDVAGNSVQRIVDSLGNILLKTLDKSGNILNQVVVGNVSTFPVLSNTTLPGGNFATVVQDPTSGTLIQVIYNTVGTILSTEVLSSS